MTRHLSSPRRHRATIAGLAIVAVVALLAIGGEIAARVTLGDRVAHAGQRLGLPDGALVSLAPGPVVPSLATGRVPLDVTMSSAGMTALAQCLPAAVGIDLSIENGQIVARKIVSLQGADVPVTVTLSPVTDSGTHRLEADAVSVGGLSIPPGAVDRILSHVPAGELLADGVQLEALLPHEITLRELAVDDTSVRLGIDVPFSLARSPSTGSPSAPGRAADCIGS